MFVYMKHDYSRVGDLRAGDPWPDKTLLTLEKREVLMPDYFLDHDEFFLAIVLSFYGSMNMSCYEVESWQSWMLPIDQISYNSIRKLFHSAAKSTMLFFSCLRFKRSPAQSLLEVQEQS